MAFVPSNYNCPLLRSLNLLQKAKADRVRMKSSLLEHERKHTACILVRKYKPIHSRKTSQDCSLEKLKSKNSPRTMRTIFIRKPQSKIAVPKLTERESSGTYFRTFALTSSREKIVNKKSLNASSFRESNKKVFRVNVTMQASLLSQDSLDEKLSPWKEFNK